MQVAADAAAYEKREILAADNALTQKLEAYVQIQQVWADAFARRQVPATVFGATEGGAGSDSDVTRFLELMTVQAARGLAVDPAIAPAAPGN